MLGNRQFGRKAYYFEYHAKFVNQRLIIVDAPDLGDQGLNDLDQTVHDMGYYLLGRAAEVIVMTGAQFAEEIERWHSDKHQLPGYEHGPESCYQCATAARMNGQAVAGAHDG